MSLCSNPASSTFKERKRRGKKAIYEKKSTSKVDTEAMRCQGTVYEEVISVKEMEPELMCCYGDKSLLVGQLI